MVRGQCSSYKLICNLLQVIIFTVSSSVEEWLYQNSKFVALMSILNRKCNMIWKVLGQLEINGQKNENYLFRISLYLELSKM